MMLKMMQTSGLVLMMMMMMVAQPTCQEENRAGVQLFEAGLPPDGRLPPFHHNVVDDVILILIIFISCFTWNTERAWLRMSITLDANRAKPHRDD